MSERATIADRGYRNYAGPLTPQSRRFVVVTKRMLRLWLRQPFVIIVLVIGWMPPLVTGVVMAVTQRLGRELAHGDVGHYVALVLLAPWGQLLSASLMALLVAAPAIAEDVERHSLPFYLARPISARQYLAGKALAAGVLLVGLTVLPSLLLAVEELLLADGDQLGAALFLLLRTPVAALILAVGLLAPALVISTWARRRSMAQVLFGVVLYLPWVLMRPLVSLSGTWWPRLLAWPAVVQHVARGIIGGPPMDDDAPFGVALLLYVVVVVGSFVLAHRQLERQGGA